jgi:hypothetical protein
MILDNTADVYKNPGLVQNTQGTLVPGGEFILLKTVKCNLQNANEVIEMKEQEFGVTGNNFFYVVFTRRDADLVRGLRFKIENVFYEIRSEVKSTVKSRHQEWICTEVVV